MLSGFRLMWMIVMFDLPVGSPSERKKATGFRNNLLDEGFEMSQFSVYMRFCSGKEHTESLCRRVEKQVPKEGKVQILFFTDKQYERMVRIDGRIVEKSRKNPEQFLLL